jgi:hypothetical protein
LKIPFSVAKKTKTVMSEVNKGFFI